MEQNPNTGYLCFMIAAKFLGILTPLMTQVVVDKVLSHHAMNTLYTIAVGIFIVYVYELAISLCRSYLFVHTTNRIDVTLSARLFHHLFGLPLKYFESRRVGETVARVRELDQIRSFLTGTPLSSMIDVFFVIVYVVVLFLYSVPLTLIVLASLPLFAILSLIITPLFKKSLDEKFETGAIANFIQHLVDLLVLVYGTKTVIDGTLSIGQLVAFRMLAGRVSGPILRLVQLWQEYQQASLSVQRIGDIFNSPVERKSDNSIQSLPTLKGRIRFENVRFRYRMDASDVLHGMSFEIEENKVIGLVGRSGSGKSTISKLIQRLYIPQSGRISIDGMDVSLMDPQMLRRQIGVVLQENFMFNGTVAENISIHCPNVTIEKIMETAKIAGAHDFIMELEEGYDTMIGEKGVSLDGGDGKDTIRDYEWSQTGGKSDRIVFGEGVSAGDVRLSRNGYDLVIGYSGDDRVTVKDAYSYQDDRCAIESIEFADGTKGTINYANTQLDITSVPSEPVDETTIIETEPSDIQPAETQPAESSEVTADFSKVMDNDANISIPDEGKTDIVQEAGENCDELQSEQEVIQDVVYDTSSSEETNTTVDNCVEILEDLYTSNQFSGEIDNVDISSEEQCCAIYADPTDAAVDNIVNLLVQDMSEGGTNNVSDLSAITDVNATDDNVQLWVS